MIGALQHLADIPWPRSAGGGVGSGSRSGAAADHSGDARHQCFVDLLRADVMNVRIDSTGGEDLAFAGDHFGTGADHDGNPLLGIGVTGLADRGDPACLDADVRFDDAPIVEDQGVGDDAIDSLKTADLALPHAVADHLAAAELDLVAVDAVILLDLDP